MRGDQQPLIIRKATPRDAPEMGRILWAAFGSKFHAFIGDCPDRGARLLADLFTTGGLALEAARVAVDSNDCPCGVCVLRLPDLAYASALPTFRVAVRHFGPWRGLWAYAGLCLFDERPRPDTGIVALLAVAPECRGQGVGGALIAAAEAEARRWGLSRLALDVIENNPAHRLYERHGFRTTRTHHLSPAFARLLGFATYDHMEKSLS